MICMDAKLNRIIFSTTALQSTLRSRLLRVSNDTCEIFESDQFSDTVPSNVEILLVSDTKWLKKVKFDGMSKLRLIQTLSAGIDSIEFEHIPREVLVCGNVGAFSDPISEHVFGMILCLAKNLIGRDESLRRSIFDQSHGIFLKGKTIGIIGTGGIGQAVARLAKAYGMVTLGVNSSGKNVEFFDKTDSIGGLNQLMSQSDIVVVALPVTVKTLNLINESNLRLTKANCILINVGRGPVINEKALYDHLRVNPSFKAGIDVWWKYPAPGGAFAQNFPFLELSNVLGSPHNADSVPESHELAVENAVQNIERYLKGLPLKGVAMREDYLGLKSMMSTK
jgi:phosphoglycerate dehydrogenase-like enzyme